MWCPGCLDDEFDPVLHRPDPCPRGMPIMAAAATYSGSVRCAVLAAKERDRRELDRPLGAMLASAIGLLLTRGSPGSGSFGPAAIWPNRLRPLWLIPVPASPAARRERSRDHVSDWTRWTVRWLRAAQIAACRVPALRRTTSSLDSVGLDAAERAANLSGAFTLAAVRAPPPGTILVVVDDIVTTGATLVEAAACLSTGFDLGQAQLTAAVVAATQRHRAV
ncbi:MAG: ComF family protein [Geodermatophilaceae bacterium]|nr:ComF family protein [Geodermatophilaceae bacterium]